MAELVDIVVPDAEQEGTESVMETWFKQVGDFVQQHEPILEINTDKVTMEVAAPVSGILKEILKQVNEPIQPGEVLGRIEPAESAAKAPATPSAAATATTASPATTAAHAAAPAPSSPAGHSAAAELSPAVRRLLRKHNIDAAQIPGSGKGGRITTEDVDRFLKSQASPAPAETAAGASSTMPSRMVPHSPMRRRTASHMVESMLKTAPHVTAVFEADLSAVIAHREAVKSQFEKKKIRLTYSTYFVSAAVAALQALPEANSRWHEDALEIFEDCNIGLAVATDAGLIVPVVHQAQKLSFEELAARLQDITLRGRDGKLRKEDLQNGTFTITNHGMTGSLIATPIINQPQSAILGIGKLEKRVVVVEKDGKETTEIRPRMYVTLTIDHRAIDGFQANQFLNAFVSALENWPGA